MALKLMKKEPETPSWLSSSAPTENVIIISSTKSVENKPSAGFIKYVKSTASSPEMQKILLSSKSEQEKYRIMAKQRRHTLTPEEMKRGQERLSEGKFGIKDTRTTSQIIQDEEIEAQYNLENPLKSKFELEKYKTLKSPSNVGLSYSTTKKYPLKETYKRTEKSEHGIKIFDPIFGTVSYGKAKKGNILGLKPQSMKIPKAIKTTLPTQKLFKPIIKAQTAEEIAKEQRNIASMKLVDIQVQKIVAEKKRKQEEKSLFNIGFNAPNISTIIDQPEIRQMIKPKVEHKVKKIEHKIETKPSSSLYNLGGMFKQPEKPKVERKLKVSIKKKPTKKFKTIKSYYRNYPKHCVKR